MQKKYTSVKASGKQTRRSRWHRRAADNQTCRQLSSANRDHSRTCAGKRRGRPTPEVVDSHQPPATACVPSPWTTTSCLLSPCTAPSADLCLLNNVTNCNLHRFSIETRLSISQKTGQYTLVHKDNILLYTTSPKIDRPENSQHLAKLWVKVGCPVFWLAGYIQKHCKWPNFNGHH